MTGSVPRTEDPRASRAQRVARAAVVLALLAAPILPLVGSGWILLAAGLPEYALDGDGALIELRVRNAAVGQQLLGSYSRLGFDHPGPLHFYLCVPLYEATGGRAASLNLTAAILQALAILGALALAARAGGMRALAAGSLVSAAYVGALGQVLITVWDPSMMIMPMLLCGVASAAFAAGRAWALPVAALSGLFAMQAHLSLVPPVSAVLVTAVATRLAVHRSSATTQRILPASIATAALVLVTGVPLLVGQLRGDPSNLARILDVLGGDGAHPSWGSSLSLAGESLASFAAGLTGIAPVGVAAVALVALQVGLCATAIRDAHRFGDRLTATLGWIALALHPAAVIAIRRIVGEVSPHMLLWIATAGVLAWWTIGTAVLRRLVESGPRARWVGGVVFAIALGTATLRASERLLVQSLVFVGAPADAARTPLLGPTADRMVQVLAELGARGARLHMLESPPRRPDNPGFTTAAGVGLALLKRGVPFEPDPAHAFAYPDGLPTPAPPIATVVLFDAASRSLLDSEGPFVEVLDLGAWGFAIRAR